MGVIQSGFLAENDHASQQPTCTVLLLRKPVISTLGVRPSIGEEASVSRVQVGTETVPEMALLPLLSVGKRAWLRRESTTRMLTQTFGGRPVPLTLNVDCLVLVTSMTGVVWFSSGRGGVVVPGDWFCGGLLWATEPAAAAGRWTTVADPEAPIAFVIKGGLDGGVVVEIPATKRQPAAGLTRPVLEGTASPVTYPDPDLPGLVHPYQQLGPLHGVSQIRFGLAKMSRRKYLHGGEWRTQAFEGRQGPCPRMVKDREHWQLSFYDDGPTTSVAAIVGDKTCWHLSPHMTGSRP